MAEPDPKSEQVEPTKTLTPQAQRALAEASERRQTVQDQVRPQEVHGRPGPEPVRYGDWENKGIASDF